MPKARASRRGHTPHTTHSSSRSTNQQGVQTQSPVASRRRRSVNTRKTSENLLMPSMVALGCWGLAFSFIFLTNSENHYLYGGMAVVMALMWTIMVGMRVARMRTHIRTDIHQQNTSTSSR